MDRPSETEALSTRTRSLPADWTVTLAPSRESLPVALHDLKEEFDAIAVAPDGGGIVFEITTRRALQDPRKAAKLQALRSAVAQAPGWNLELLVTPEPPPPLDSASEIESRLRSALQLADQHPAAAYLVGFTALEWSLAQLCVALGLDYSHNAHRMASALVETGELDEETVWQVRKAQELRNRLAHAVSGPSTSRTDVDHLIELVEMIQHPMAGDAS